jgi:hypothetical protein
MNIFSDTWARLLALYRARYEPENLRPLADMYWRTMLSLMLISVAGVVAFGVWEFVAVVENLASGQNNDNSTPPVVLNRSQLETTLSIYGARQAQFQAAQSALVTVADPSK